MTRYVRNTVIQAKLESTYGTNPGSFTAGDAILIRNPSFRIDRDVVPRELVRGYLGASEHLIGTRRAIMEFEVELAPVQSGAAGTAPQWGQLLRACGMAQTITASTRVEYTPVSTAFESLSMRFWNDGVLYTARGCRGTVSFDMTAYGIPVMRFTFWGFDVWASTLSSLATDFGGWRRPQIITDENSGDIKLGSTYSAGTVSGGTTLGSRGMMIDLGNTLSHIKLLGGEAIEITNREVTGSMTVQLASADEVTWRSDINSNVLTGLAFTIGSGAGTTIQIFAPQVQRINPQISEYEGRSMMSSELRLLPSGTSGNDELRVIVK